MRLVIDGVEYALIIPDVVWSGVLAALITLTGVWLANKNSRRQLREQQLHVSAESALERQMELRKEVLIDAVSWANGAVMSVSRLLLIGQDLTESDELKSLTDTPCRVPIVGNSRTNKCFSDIVLLHTRALARLVPMRGTLDRTRRRMNELSEALEPLADTDMTEQDIRKELKDSIAAMSKLVPEFFAEVYETLQKLERLQVPLIVSVREELNIPTEEGFINTMDSVGEDQVHAVRAMTDGQLAGYGLPPLPKT